MLPVLGDAGDAGDLVPAGRSARAPARGHDVAERDDVLVLVDDVPGISPWMILVKRVMGGVWSGGSGKDDSDEG